MKSWFRRLRQLKKVSSWLRQKKKSCLKRWRHWMPKIKKLLLNINNSRNRMKSLNKSRLLILLLSNLKRKISKSLLSKTTSRKKKFMAKTLSLMKSLSCFPVNTRQSNLYQVISNSMLSLQNRKVILKAQSISLLTNSKLSKKRWGHRNQRMTANWSFLFIV